MVIFINSRIHQEKYSGIQNYISNLYSKILELDNENNYIFLQTKNIKSLWTTKIGGYFPWNIGKILFDSLLILFLMRKSWERIFHWPSFALPILKLSGYKYVVTVHDLAFLIYPEYYSWFFRKYMYLTILNSTKKADTIICISESTKRDLLYFFPKAHENKTCVIPLWVSDDFFLENDMERIIPHKYFFSLTTHPKRKNILRILDILHENKEEFKDCLYVIAWIFGKESRLDLENRIQSLGLLDRVIIFWYASPDEVKNLYRNAEFFLYPSYYEWFWLPILEAMALWCPVISGNNSSLPEVNVNAECLFDAHDNADIFEKMKYILNLDAVEKDSLIKNNREFARSMSWENTAKKTIKIFQSLDSNK